METLDYQDKIEVHKESWIIYQALTTGIPFWWTEDFIGDAFQVSDVFTIRFGKTIKTFKVEELVKNEKVVWRCVDAFIDMSAFKNKNEWIGTKIVWEILAHQSSATIVLTHEGLTRDKECYEVCEKGWQRFIESLSAFLTTGKGSPFKIEEPLTH